MFFEIGVLESFEICTGKDLCWRLFYIKLQALKIVFPLNEKLTRLYSNSYIMTKNSFAAEVTFDEA